MDLVFVKNTLAEYAKVYSVFKDAERFINEMETAQTSYASFKTQYLVSQDELNELEGKVQKKKQELSQLSKDIEAKQKEAEDNIQRLYDNKIKSATEKAAEILKEARDKFHENTYHVRLLEEDAKIYTEKIDKAKQELDVLEAKTLRIKSELRTIIGQTDE
jgi:chromosome segregation ATPase